MADRRPVVGLLCCNEVAGRAVQVVASRFLEPLSTIAAATVLLIPTSSDADDILAISHLLDGLLLTGSRSNVAARRYGGTAEVAAQTLDEARDEVALALAGRMIEAGKPVYGVCRGLQEINVLFGGTLSSERCAGRHHLGSWDADYDRLFDHRHDVLLTAGGTLSNATRARRLTVNSVHEQGIDRLGGGLSIEALASEDGLIEAFSAHPCGADVLAVQWHPEWDVDQSPGSRAFFSLLGRALRHSATARPGRHRAVPVSRPLPAAAAAASLRGH